MFSSNTSQVAATATQAEAIDFDGTNDYLIRSSDLTGNTDGKTFTFSAWVWRNFTTGSKYIYTTDNTTDARVQIYISDTAVGLFMKNSSGTVILNASATINLRDTFINILWSVDLASTSNRSLYINDVLQTVTWTTYTNANIDFTQPNHNIGGGPTLGEYIGGRLSNVYLDKTYRDMSITANRRLFVTADLKPAAGQAALNPILYLPMSDPTQPGKNLGTGGDFTLTGTVARSGRGPNQYNAPYSDLDGGVSNQHLSRTTALTGIADSKTITCSFCFNADAVSGGLYTLAFSDGTSAAFHIYISAGNLYVEGKQSAGGSNCLLFNFGTFVVNRNYHVVFSLDLTDSAKRFVYVNGQPVSPTWTTYTNNAIDFTYTSPRIRVGIQATATLNHWNGRLGNVYFDTSYIDLSQPANLAKFVTGTGIDAKPVDLGANGELPTGTSPLIYLPMYGNNAGKNYGTGGDFSVVSGPYTGARGPNEFWGNWAVFDNTDYLLRSSIALSTSTITLSFFITVTAVSGDGYIFEGWTSGNSTRFRCTLTGARYLRLEGWDSSGVKVLDITSNGTLSGSTTPYHVAISFNLSNSAQRHFYINNVDVASSWSTYSSGTMNIAKTYISSNNLPLFNSKLAEFYLSTTYVDFSQEANRLKFRDAFGNPVDLTQQIEAAAIPNPAIYMRFPPTAFGTNYGTGGNFTVNGTITDGGQL